MQPHIHVITLAVSDLGRALEFYRDGLGLESAGVIGTEFAGDETNPAGAVAMFQLHGGLILALYPRTELAKDANIPFGPPKAGEFSIGHAVAGKEDVDALLAKAEAAGATVTDRPHDLGYLLWLLPRPRRAPVGDHVEPSARGPLVSRGTHWHQGSPRVGINARAV
jgi:catechol 2,3-dioxygenase-like lactoylglutathione lyase family enzyme